MRTSGGWKEMRTCPPDTPSSLCRIARNKWGRHSCLPKPPMSIATTPVANKQDVLERLRANEPRLKSLGVRRYGLFGSFVRDEARPDSDVDLLVEFEENQETFD